VLIDSRLQQRADVHADGPAIADSGETLSWSELEAAVAAAALRYRSSGLRSADRVGLALRDGVDFLVAMLGAMRARLVVVPLDWRSRPAERQQLAAAYGLRAILASRATAPALSSDGGRPDRSSIAATDDDDAERDQLILLSSGTTGQPTGAVISRRALEARILNGANVLGDLGQHRYLSCIPLSFSLGLLTALRVLAFGGSVRVQPPIFTPPELLESLRSTRSTLVCMVPPMLRACLKIAGPTPLALPDLRAVITGGAAITPAERAAVLELICRNGFETYGAAAAGPITYASFDDLLAHPGSVGRLQPWLGSRVLDDGGNVLPAKDIGLLQVRGPTIASALVAADGQVTPLTDGWYAPGDIARIDDAGYLYVEGRATDVINRDGFNVYPEVVEQALGSHPSVREVAVVGGPGGDQGERVVALVLAAGPVTVAQLQAHARTLLSPKSLPDEIVLVDDLPRTVSGKVQRKAAAARWLWKMP
jgi:acyl-CoA synthetase (AMP-forming)/AMP-acid ligase II